MRGDVPGFGATLNATGLSPARGMLPETVTHGTLDTALQSPDGYELSYGDRRSGGLLLELFGGSRGYEPRLRKGGRSVAISAGAREPFGYNGIEFLGWVTARH